MIVEFRRYGSSDEYHAGIISDYENDRLSIESEAPELCYGDMLELRMKPPGKDRTVIASSDVVMVRKRGYGFIAEVMIHELSEDDQNVLDEMTGISLHPRRQQKGGRDR